MRNIYMSLISFKFSHVVKDISLNDIEAKLAALEKELEEEEEEKEEEDSEYDDNEEEEQKAAVESKQRNTKKLKLCSNFKGTGWVWSISLVMYVYNF